MADASDMITVQSNGGWHIRPTSPAYGPGAVEIEVTVTLSHVDPSVLNKKGSFQITMISPCALSVLSISSLVDMNILIGPGNAQYQ